MMLQREEVIARAEAYRSQGRRVVFTNGCFDILHLGHLRLLKWSKEQGDFLFVGLNSDSSVSRLKGDGRPVNDEKTRAEILKALRFVDHVVVFGNDLEENDTPEHLIREIKPDVLVKGGDYDVDAICGAEFVRDLGGEVRIFPTLEGHSTTSIIQKFQNRK